MSRRARIVGVVLLVWFAGSIVGGAGVWYLGERGSSELRHDHNALICVLRSIVKPARARSYQTANDMTQSPSARLRAKNAYTTDDTILASLLTIPRNFDCATLSTKKT